MPEPTLSAVLFDWGGTLTPWHTIDLSDCWFSVTGDEAQTQAVLAAEAAAWHAVHEDHSSAHIDAILTAAAVTLTDTQRRAYYDWWDAHTYTDPAVTEVFTALRERGLKIGILSNTVWPATEHERIFARDGVDHLIDGAVYSSEIGRIKPHADAFRAALDAVGVSDPTRAVYVGDRLYEDVWGANQLGMRAVLIPHSDIPEVQKTGVEGTPDAIIQQLTDLVPVIDGWLVA